MSSTIETADSLYADIRRGQRRALARSLSLLESSLPADRELAYALLERCQHQPNPSWRIGCTGPPGVGKSTFIERLGCILTDTGRSVAVLAVDPSSRRSGGSILGDKVRMLELGQRANAFIRPTPSKATLGGAAPSTRDAIVLCEQAGFDTIIIETVGVGQSEIDVATMVDMFLLLALPNSGDDVQGIKRGIMEVAHAVVVTKSDLDAAASKRSAAQITSALRYMIPTASDWQTPVHVVSNATGDGFDTVIDALHRFFDNTRAATIDHQRRQQRGEWFDRVLSSEMLQRLLAMQEFRSACDVAREQSVLGRMAPSLGVHRLLDRIQMLITEVQ
ncbi:MAG: methylmalonyl Co-A mutase-associated GTPase MeaB [Candidatus Kapabacteria bacterium]|nr:methylmalonyl Co-A mutase-associated GTPase MeaB [Candidatus Kapabacteria bacterium]